MRKAVSSVYGEITGMLLTYPNGSALPDDIILQRYRGIFEALGTNIVYVILAYPEVHNKLKQCAKMAGLSPKRNLLLVPAVPSPYAAVRKLLAYHPDGGYIAEIDDIFHSIWAQDAYCVLNDHKGIISLLEPLFFTRGGDHFIAEQIAAHTKIEIESTEYHVEGGNVLVGDNYALIGRDFLAESIRISGETAPQVTRGLCKVLGVEHLFWIGSKKPLAFPLNVFQGTYQPVFHIDMYITLGGKTTGNKELVFVGDTRSAKKILGQKPVPEVISKAFDKTADWFANYKGPGPRFKVKRLPLDLWFNDNSEQSATFLTYNNCLIEVFGKKKNVYLPSYSSVAPASENRRKLDAFVAKQFAASGFKVTMMNGAYEELCKRGGSIHCITKTLKRRG
jgi:hypothetical protein